MTRPTTDTIDANETHALGMIQELIELERRHEEAVTFLGTTRYPAMRPPSLSGFCLVDAAEMAASFDEAALSPVEEAWFR
jgi:hypothetical protein